ncbi:MAG: STAS domain-containing protein [Spirochaetia bacterium]|nr:STAS domain-containing protein [Spirochaetia bacterium]
MNNIPEEIKITVSSKDKHTIIEIDGDVNLYSVSQLRKNISQLIDDGNHSIIIDMKNVRYMDSSGIALLANLQKKIKTTNGFFGILQMNNEIKNILRLAALEKYFSIYDDINSLP